MTKRLYNKNFIILLILCNSDKNFSSNFPYNLMQNIIGKILDIVPPIKDNNQHLDNPENNIDNPENNINNPENNINNENNNIQNIQNNQDIQDENNQQPINNIQISYPKLIEEHYIWVACLGTLLKYYKMVENNDGNELLHQINLDEPINTFFKEPNKGKTTLQNLSNFFNNKSLKKNFITEKKTFINVIEEYSDNFKRDNHFFNIILELKKKLEENNKRKIALFWMFTVALGRHAAAGLSEKAKQLKEGHFFGGDYIKTNTLKYIEISFKERANLYKKLENMFLLFYKLAGENVGNDTFISKICENMKNNICDACFYKSFINLMYRNRNKNENEDDGYMDLVEAIRRV